MWKRKPKLSQPNRASSRLQVEALSDRIVPTISAGGVEPVLAQFCYTTVPSDQDAESVIDTNSFTKGEIADPTACYFLPPSSDGGWCGTVTPGWDTTEEGEKGDSTGIDEKLKIIDFTTIERVEENSDPLIDSTVFADRTKEALDQNGELIETPILYAFNSVPVEEVSASGDSLETDASVDSHVIDTLSFQTGGGEDGGVKETSSEESSTEGETKELPAAEGAPADNDVWYFGSQVSNREEAVEDGSSDETVLEEPSKEASSEEGSVDPELLYMTGVADDQGSTPKEETPVDSETTKDDSQAVTATSEQDEVESAQDTRTPDPVVYMTTLPVDGGIDLIKGSGTGTYTIHTGLPDVGKEYSLQGTGTIPGIAGQVGIAGEIRSLGFVRIGQARGMLTFTTSQGSLTVSVLGVEQAGFSNLPETFEYRVVGGTGAFLGSTGKGALKLTLQSGNKWTANLFFDDLVGTGTGTYTVDEVHALIADAGIKYNLQGTATLAQIGETTFTGSATSLGFAPKGNATGQLILTNAKGSLSLNLKGPEQLGGAALPKKFEYTVTSATGDFSTLMPKGQFILILKPDGTITCTFGEMPTNETPGGNSDRQLGLKVDSFYMNYLGRAADTQGRAHWVSVLKSGVSPEDVIKSFLLSKEYGSAHAGSQSEYIKSLYTKVLGREASDAEVYVWTQNWNTGLNQEGVVKAILGSEEAIKYSVKSFYQGYLHRDADASGLAAWLKGIQSGNVSLDQVAMRFLNSAEYLAKTGQGYIM